VEQYDTVFVGFPIWWGIEPRAVDTFLESCDFSGKAMVPFATSGGSAMPPAERHLREQYPAFTWKAGQLVTPRTAGAWAQSALGR
ncbi:MAG: flavodoxin, partial [Acutalibacter sp.]